MSLLWQHCDLTIEPMQPKYEWVKLKVSKFFNTQSKKKSTRQEMSAVSSVSIVYDVQLWPSTGVKFAKTW